MLLLSHLSELLTSYRMLSLGPIFRIPNVRVIDEHGGNIEGLEDDVDFVAHD